MIQINTVESVKADSNGMTLKHGEHEIFLSWKVIDEIAEASEPHYVGNILEEFAIMTSQTKMN